MQGAAETATQQLKGKAHKAEASMRETANDLSREDEK